VNAVLRRSRPASAQYAVAICALLQPKPLLAHECAPAGALGGGVLAHLVLRPTVEVGSAEHVGGALRSYGRHRRAAAIVGVDRLLDAGLAEAVAVHCRRQRQAQAHMMPARRPAETKPRER